MHTLDTNAIIYFFKNDPRAIAVFKEIFGRQGSVYVSSVTEIELFSFSRLSVKETSQFATFLSIVSVVPLNSKIARMAGFLRRIYKLTLPDSAIAATALVTASTLVTRNVGDFKKIAGLRVLEL